MLARRNALAAKIIFSALEQLEQNGGELHVSVLKEKVFNKTALDDWEKVVLPHGETRWWSALQRYSHEYVKAGMLKKNKGYWTITEVGKAVLAKDAVEAFFLARDAYNEWKKRNVS